MKLQLAGSGGINLFTAYGENYVTINQQQHTQSLIVLPEQPVEMWSPCNMEELTPTHFEAILRYRPEIILFGSGATLRFPSIEIRRTLANALIGLEVMDTFAACRTYNILAGEGRKVAAALLMPR